MVLFTRASAGGGLAVLCGVCGGGGQGCLALSAHLAKALTAHKGGGVFQHRVCQPGLVAGRGL